MQIILSLILVFAFLSSCGVGENVKLKLPGKNTPQTDAQAPPEPIVAEKPALTEEQTTIANAAQPVKWPEQAITWKLPSGWKKVSASKSSFEYEGPNGAKLIATISTVSDDFPTESGLRKLYDESMARMGGQYESVRFVEIDGVKGVELVEAPAGQRGGGGRQWTGFRSYGGQVQMLNVKLSGSGGNAARRSDEFAAILYSTEFGNSEGSVS